MAQVGVNGSAQQPEFDDSIRSLSLGLITDGNHRPGPHRAAHYTAAARASAPVLEAQRLSPGTQAEMLSVLEMQKACAQPGLCQPRAGQSTPANLLVGLVGSMAEADGPQVI